MFLELNRVKEDMILVKNKTGLNVNLNSNEPSGPKMILGVNSGLGNINQKKDERRYELPNSSANSSIGGVFDVQNQHRFNYLNRNLAGQRMLMSS